MSRRPAQWARPRSTRRSTSATLLRRPRPGVFTDTPSVRRVVDEAFADLGRIVVGVSNAGYGLLGAAEEPTGKQIERQIATNLTIQLARAVTPHLRAQGGGRILQISSQGGRIAFPGLSLNHASKWGIEGFFESSAQEVAPFGITTTLVEPDEIGTGFFDVGGSSDVAPALEEYAGTAAAWFRDGVDAGAMPGDPLRTAEAILALGDAERAPARQLLGSDALQGVPEVLAARREHLLAGHELAVSADREGVPA